MKKCRLTEKKMSNKRFKKTEQAILIAYFRFHDYPVAKKIAKSAKVSRSTLYRHHQTTTNIPYDYEEYLLQAYLRTIHKLSKKKNPSLKTILLRTLVFIASNRDVFLILFQSNHKEVIKKMLDHIKHPILEEWRLGGDLNKMYSIYKNEVLGAIEIWGKANFSNQTLNSALEAIIYLTKTARHNLLPLESKSTRIKQALDVTRV